MKAFSRVLSDTDRRSPRAEELRVQSSIRVDAPGFYSVYFVHCSAGELISGEVG